MLVEVLEDIRKELRELRFLYKELVEKLIPTEKPTPKEKSYSGKDELADEEEFIRR
jgi:hypothetical protein